MFDINGHIFEADLFKRINFTLWCYNVKKEIYCYAILHKFIIYTLMLMFSFSQVANAVMPCCLNIVSNEITTETESQPPCHGEETVHHDASDSTVLVDMQEQCTDCVDCMQLSYYHDHFQLKQLNKSHLLDSELIVSLSIVDYSILDPPIIC